MKNIKSNIYTSDVVHNKNRTKKDGNLSYFFAYVHFDKFDEDTDPEPAMFTFKQIEEAMDRAKRIINCEEENENKNR